MSNDRLHFVQHLSVLSPHDSYRDGDMLFDPAGLTRAEAALSAVECMCLGLTKELGCIVRAHGALSEFSAEFVEGFSPKGWSRVISISGGDLAIPLTGIDLQDGDIFSFQSRNDPYESLLRLAVKADIQGVIYQSDRVSILGLMFDLFLNFEEPNLYRCQEDKFCFDLPVLKSRHLQKPELALAVVQHLSDGEPAARAYENVLFFATPEMVDLFGGDIEPFVPRRILRVWGIDDGDPVGNKLNFGIDDTGAIRDLPAGLFGPDITVEYPYDLSLRHVELGFDGLGGTTISDGQARALQAYGSVVIKHGLGIPDGYVLCSAKASFLATLDFSDYSEVRLQVSRSRLEQVNPYIDVELHMLSRGTDTGIFFTCDELVKCLFTAPLAGEMFNIIPSVVWNHIGHKSGGGWARLAFFERYPEACGSHVDCTLSLDDLSHMSATGIRIPSNAQLRLAYDGKTSYVDACKMMLKACDDTVTIDEFRVNSDPYALLDRASKIGKPVGGEPATAVFKVLSELHGIEAMVDAASNDTDWLWIAEAYSRDELDPFTGRMPATTRVRIACNDFNL